MIDKAARQEEADLGKPGKNMFSKNTSNLINSKLFHVVNLFSFAFKQKKVKWNKNTLFYKHSVHIYIINHPAWSNRYSFQTTMMKVMMMWSR